MINQETLRKSNKLERLIKQATFNDPTAAIENIEYHPDRRLDKKLILELGTGKPGFPMHLVFMHVVSFIKGWHSKLGRAQVADAILD